MNDIFEDCVERKNMKDGSLEIHCKRGNFSVIGPDKEVVEREARRYWIQYFSDGDYDTLLEQQA